MYSLRVGVCLLLSLEETALGNALRSGMRAAGRRKEVYTPGLSLHFGYLSIVPEEQVEAPLALHDLAILRLVNRFTKQFLGRTMHFGPQSGKRGGVDDKAQCR